MITPPSQCATAARRSSARVLSQLIETCKADAELNAIPIMAVTAYAGKEDEERVRAAGAEAYVSKPISLMRFIGEVIALTPKAEEPVDETAADETEPDDGVPAEPPVIEDLFPESAPAEAVPAEELLPEDLPQDPPAEVAAAEDPLPEDEAIGMETGEGEDRPVASEDEDGAEDATASTGDETPPTAEPPAAEADDEKPI